MTGKPGIVFDENVKKLFDFVNARVNPFNKPVAKVPLYNFITNQKVNPDVEERLLNVLVNGQDIYLQIRKETFVDKTRKLTDTIHRRMLPSFTTESPKEKVQVILKLFHYIS